MKAFIIYFISLAGLFALNNIFSGLYRAAAPNFLFLFAVFYAFKKNNLIFLPIAFFAGLILDLFSGNFFGAQTLALLITCSLLSYATSTFFSADLSVELSTILIALGYLFFVSLAFAFNFTAHSLHLINFNISPNVFEIKIWLDMLLNFIFATPIYYLTALIGRLTAAQQKI